VRAFKIKTFIMTGQNRLRDIVESCCVATKSIIPIFLLTCFIGAVYSKIIIDISRSIEEFGIGIQNKDYHIATLIMVNCILAIVGLLYPLAGFIADIYSGRFKMIVAGLIILFIASLLLSIQETLSAFNTLSSNVLDLTSSWMCLVAT